MAAPTELDGKLVVRVYLLDNSLKTLLTPGTASIDDVGEAMAEKLGLPEPTEVSRLFALHECRDGVTIERPLQGDIMISDVVESWEEDSPAKLVYMIKIYTDTLMSSENEKLVYMMYIQGVYNVITSMYPTTEAEIIQLAAYQVQVKFGMHNESTHKYGFLTSSIQEYIPKAHLDNSDNKGEDWEDKIFAKHKHQCKETPNAMLGYLALLKKRDYYGSSMYIVKQDFTRVMPKRIILAVTKNGIQLLKKPTSLTAGDMVTLAKYSLSEVFRWAFKPGVTFYYEIKVDDEEDDYESNPIYTFQTNEGHHISGLLTSYAMALLREMGLAPDGTSIYAPEDEGPMYRDSLEDGPSFAEIKAQEAEAKLAELEAETAQVQAELEKERASKGNPEDEEAYGGGAEDDAPEGWSKLWDDTHEAYYYYNNATGDSTWEYPTY